MIVTFALHPIRPSLKFENSFNPTLEVLAARGKNTPNHLTTACPEQ